MKAMKSTVVVLMVALATGTAAAADPLAQKVKEAGSKDAVELIRAGNLLLEAHRTEEAKRAFKDAAMRMTDKSEAALGLALIRMYTSDLHQSKVACRNLKEEYPSSDISGLCYGQVWLTFGRSARAIEDFEAIVKKGGDVRARTGLARTYALMNETDRAIETFRGAIDAGAGYEARLGLGLALEQKGRRDEALAALKATLDEQPLSSLARYHYGRLLGAGKEARSHIEQALALRPDWADGLGTLGDLLLAEGNAADALVAFRKASTLEPERGAFRLGLGRALYQQKNYAEARTELDKALSLVPSYVDATLMLADVELAAGDEFKAADLAERAVALSPDSADVCIGAAQLFHRMKRYTKANAYYQKAAALLPGSSTPLIFLGDIACERQLFKEGADYYAAALKGDLKEFRRSDIEARAKKCR
jgi:tetratricopeptide (TPR) repeat protein